MSDNEFIDEVVNEVLKRLNHTTNQNFLIKDHLYLVGPADVELLHELETQYHIITSKDLDNPNYFKQGAISEDSYDAVLVTNLPMNSMVHLVHGTYQTIDEQVILNALLCGKSVTLFSEGIIYKKYKATASKALYLKYIEYEDKLKHYGINIISKRDFTLRTLEKKQVQIQPDLIYINELPGNIQYSKQQEYSKRNEYSKQNECSNQNELPNHNVDFVDFTGKKLILEKDMMERKSLSDKVIKVSRNCIITPMAQDMIREQRITILRSSD